MKKTAFIVTSIALSLSACTSSNLDAGLNEQVASKPIDAITPPSVVANNSAQPIQQTAMLPNAQNPTAASQASQQAQAGQTQMVGPVAFLPVTGAPQGTVSTLAKSIRQSATQNSVSIVPTSAQAKYEVKGYFSALDDGNGTLLVYVWDVLDKSGKRVHRISGQERAGSSASDPWSAISNAQIDQVATSTMRSLKSWLASHS